MANDLIGGQISFVAWTKIEARDDPDEIIRVLRLEGIAQMILLLETLQNFRCEWLIDIVPWVTRRQVDQGKNNRVHQQHRRDKAQHAPDQVAAHVPSG